MDRLHGPDGDPGTADGIAENMLIIFTDSGTFELYDVVNDPGETTNLAALDKRSLRTIGPPS